MFTWRCINCLQVMYYHIDTPVVDYKCGTQCPLKILLQIATNSDA